MNVQVSSTQTSQQKYFDLCYCQENWGPSTLSLSFIRYVIYRWKYERLSFIHSFTCLLAYLLDVDSSFHLRSSRDHITSVPQIQWFTWTPILLSSIKAKTNTYKIRPNKSLLIIYTEFHWKLESWNYKETISWRFLFQTIVKFSGTECSVKACTEKGKVFRTRHDEPNKY